MNALFRKCGAKVPEAALHEKAVEKMLNDSSISIEKIRSAAYKHLVCQWGIGSNIEGHLIMLRLSIELTDQVIVS